MSLSMPRSVAYSRTTRRSWGSRSRRTRVSTTVVTVPGVDQPRAATSLDFSPLRAASTRSTASPAPEIPVPWTVWPQNVPMVREASGSNSGRAASSGMVAPSSPQAQSARLDRSTADRMSSGEYLEVGGSDWTAESGVAAPGVRDSGVAGPDVRGTGVAGPDVTEPAWLSPGSVSNY